MGLDIRTMMVTLSVLCLLLSGLLGLTGLHASSVRGIRSWALASLCISAAMGLALFQLGPDNGAWLLVIGSTLTAWGMSLQHVGIQEFSDKGANWRLPIAFTTLVCAQSYWFSIAHPDVGLRAIANSLAFALINAACASSLLKPMPTPLRNAYWLTGGSFALMALVFFARALFIALSPDGGYGLYANLAINPTTFFAASIVQLSATFGFVLMLNYRLSSELHELAARDSLTAAYNRRSLETELSRLLARSRRTGDPVALMMIDVDHFKGINDRFGHGVGDEVLRRLAATVRETIRTEDYFARYGGEEFCIVLPATAAGEARVLAERLRQRYAAMRMNSAEVEFSSTISIGLADTRQCGLDQLVLLAAADRALYRAKRAGRDQVQFDAVDGHGNEALAPGCAT